MIQKKIVKNNLITLHYSIRFEKIVNHQSLSLATPVNQLYRNKLKQET